MQDSPPIGQRYSLVYLKPDHDITDSTRLRRRVLKVLQDIAPENTYRLGSLLERELGISVLHKGYHGAYVKWDDLLRWEMRDILCAITLIFRESSVASKVKGFALVTELRRVFAEEHAAYTVDDQGGVHPFVDSSYQAQVAAVLGGLGTAGNSGALAFVQKADQQLMPDGDPREAIRAIFDAVENLFKIMFKGAISLNTAMIKKHLQPHLQRSGAEYVEQRASQKLCASLIEWVDACHNYRHAPGDPDPAAPSDALAVALVSQGLGYVRWLSDLQRSAQAAQQ